MSSSCLARAGSSAREKGVEEEDEAPEGEMELEGARRLVGGVSAAVHVDARRAERRSVG